MFQIRMQEFINTWRDVINLLHFSTCDHQLLHWEILIQAVICFDILNVGVFGISSEESKIFLFRIILNNLSHTLNLFILIFSCKIFFFFFDVRTGAIHFLKFFYYCYKETTCVLVVRHHSQAFWHFRQDLFGIVACEHCVFDQAIVCSWYITKLIIRIKV